MKRIFNCGNTYGRYEYYCRGCQSKIVTMKEKNLFCENCQCKQPLSLGHYWEVIDGIEENGQCLVYGCESCEYIDTCKSVTNLGDFIG